MRYGTRRLFFRALILTLLLVCQSVHDRIHAQCSGLPVLRVYVDGTFYSGMDYVNGMMQLTDTEGNVVELPARFKVRGATAQNYMMKPSLNMKLRTDDYSEELDSALLGIRSCSSWILDAMSIDRICMRNRVAFDIWNEFSRLPYDTEFGGRNGTEGSFVEVYINDEYYGIYDLTDRINRKLLNLKKTKTNEDGSVQIRGVLYKNGTTDILEQEELSYNDDSTACVIAWHNAWELTYPDEYGGKVAWTPLLDAFEEGQSADFAKKYFFLENLADYQILVMALSISDNWGNKNHFLSVRNINKDIDDQDPSESDRRRFVISPWDLDTSLGGSFDGSCYNGSYYVFPLELFRYNGFYPYIWLLEDSEYEAVLKRRWTEVRNGALSIESVNEKLEGYRDLFIESGAWQRMVDHYELWSEKPLYVKDLAQEINLIEKWYVNRFHEMDAYFGIADGIEAISMPASSQNAVYDIWGRKVDSAVLSPGIYISDGNLFFAR